MKKFFIICCILVAVILIFDFLYYRLGIYIDFEPNKELTTSVKTVDKDIYLETNSGFEKFEIKGVDLGIGIPRTLCYRLCNR